ncbi:MAG: hypothetical protein ACLFSQ_12205 [Candidatus Zixiibacteriota bacterium]
MRKVVLILLIVIVGIGFGIGIKISPATIVATDIPPGEVIDIYKEYGHIIRVFGAPSNVTYHIEPIKPSEANTKITGYVDIHNPDWFWTEIDTLLVPGPETSVTDNPMYIKFPDNDQWYNRHYLVGVSVSPISKEGMGSLVLGAFLQFRLETEAKAGVVPTVFEENEYVFVPSAIELGEIERGKEYINKVEIYTGLYYNHDITLEPLDPESPVGKITILPTPGYKRVHDSTWVFYDNNYDISSKKPAEAYISVYIPKRTPQGRYEELIFLESSVGNAFLRIRFTIKD